MTKELTDKQIEEGWEQTFSTRNPYCPCDLKSFTKAVKWAERELHVRPWVVVIHRDREERMTCIDHVNHREYVMTEKNLADTPEPVRDLLRQLIIQASQMP